VTDAGDSSSGSFWITLTAMTLSASMILVDQTAVPLATPHVIEDLGGQLNESQWLLTANILPLAGFMVLGGRLGDLYGLRKIFLIGALVFGISTTLAGLAQNMTWMIAARAAQGTGAALMMPTSVAIVSSVAPNERRGAALGVLAGGSAFFAALGPVLGGILTAIDWRLVFLVNVPLAAVAVTMTLSACPRLAPDPDANRNLDFPGVVSFALGIGALTFGFAQGQGGDWTEPATFVPLIVGVLSLAAFVLVELRSENPMIEFRLFRHLNYLAANLSQMLAGMIELGLGFMLPLFLLLVVGVGPAEAGIALIPGTIPIILVGPLAGRIFDRYGGRVGLVIGFLFLAASGLALASAASDANVSSLIPGLVLQGIGLGLVLTTNDPTGLTAIGDEEQGQGAGVINTTEQFGGAIGIAVLVCVEYTRYKDVVFGRLADRGVHPTPAQDSIFRDFIQHAEQIGLKDALRNARGNRLIDSGINDVLQGHISGFELMFTVSAGIAVVGALMALLTVRRSDRVVKGRVFARRSRWITATSGRSSAITRVPDPVRHPDAPTDGGGTGAG